MDELHQRELLCRLGRKLWQRGLVAGNDGNLSLRLGEGRFLVTPTRVSKGEMTPELLVEVDWEGRAVEPGPLAPTSELPLHLQCYRDRPDVGGICHAHPPAATTFACAGRSPEWGKLVEARISLGHVPVVPYAPNGTQELCRAAAPYLPGHDALLLASHGAITLGRDLEEAYYRMETLEHSARICLNLRLLEGAGPVS